MKGRKTAYMIPPARSRAFNLSDICCIGGVQGLTVKKRAESIRKPFDMLPELKKHAEHADWEEVVRYYRDKNREDKEP